MELKLAPLLSTSLKLSKDILLKQFCKNCKISEIFSDDMEKVVINTSAHTK